MSQPSAYRDAGAFDEAARRRRACDEPVRGADGARASRPCCTRPTRAAPASFARRRCGTARVSGRAGAARHDGDDRAAHRRLCRAFRRAENRGFDLYHAHDGISGNALATLKADGTDQRLRSHGPSHRRLRGSSHRAAAGAGRSARRTRGWRSAACGASGCARTSALTRELSETASIARVSIPSRTGKSRRSAHRLGLGPGPIFLVRRRRRGAEEHAAHPRCVCVSSRRCVPTRELVVAGGASLLDHGAYQQAFRARLEAMGGRGRFRPCSSASSPTGTCRDSIVSHRRWFSLRSRKGSAFACSKRWRAACRSLRRASSRSSSYLAPEDAIWCDPDERDDHRRRHGARAAATSACAPCAQRGPTIAARFDWRSVAEAHEPQYRRLLEVANA